MVAILDSPDTVGPPYFWIGCPELPLVLIYGRSSHPAGIPQLQLEHRHDEGSDLVVRAPTTSFCCMLPSQLNVNCLGTPGSLARVSYSWVYGSAVVLSPFQKNKKKSSVAVHHHLDSSVVLIFWRAQLTYA